jgi:hypothetical protein
MSPHQMANAIDAIGSGGLVSFNAVYARMTRDNALMVDLLTLLHESSLQEAERVFMSAYIDTARDEITAAYEANKEIDNENN